VPVDGQRWTTPAGVVEGRSTDVRELEPGLTGIGLTPSFAIGQRMLLVAPNGGNVLWDMIPVVSDEALEAVRERGGATAIAISHPHCGSAGTSPARPCSTGPPARTAGARIYGAWWDRVVPADAKGAVQRGVDRYLRALRGELPLLTRRRADTGAARLDLGEGEASLAPTARGKGSSIRRRTVVVL
jgi:hypothetical protein